MSKVARWGILGVAKINERVFPSFEKASNAQLYAIASRSLERAQHAAAEWEIPVAHGSYEALLADPNIDVVYVPLPNSLHAEWVRKAAEAGKHILCEKPLTPDADEAAELVEFCKNKKVCLMDGFMWPHHPRTAQLRAFLDSGRIGPVQRVSATFTFRMASLDSPNIRLRSDLAGGSLLDVGCYPVYGIRWVFQAEPVRVWASARFERDVDVEMNGMLWFEDGRVATFDCGFVHPLRQWLEVTGTEGTVFVQDMWLPPRRAAFEIRMAGEYDIQVQAVDGHDQIRRMIENFSRAALENSPVSPDPRQAVKTLRVLNALDRSARTGKIVEL